MEKQTLRQHGPTVQALITHLLSVPDLHAHLRRLHDLALYESGDALIGPEEKESLLHCRHLADMLELIPQSALRSLL